MCISLIMRTTLIYIRKVGIDMAKNIDDWFIWVEANRDTPTRQWTEEVLPPAKQALYKDLLELIGTAQPCEPDCSPERHAYHEGQYQTILRQEKALATYFGVEE